MIHLSNPCKGTVFTTLEPSGKSSAPFAENYNKKGDNQAGDDELICGGYYMLNFQRQRQCWCIECTNKGCCSL